MPGEHSQPTPTSFGSRVYACLGVTCHLHFWQNNRGLLHAIVVTGGGMDTEYESAKVVNLEEKKSLASHAGT